MNLVIDMLPVDFRFAETGVLWGDAIPDRLPPSSLATEGTWVT